MKKTFSFALLAIVMCWACNKEIKEIDQPEPETPQETQEETKPGVGTATLTFGIEQDEQAVKGTFVPGEENKLQFQWQEGDQIGVYLYSTKENSNYGPWIAPFDIQSGVGESTATFRRDLNLDIEETYGNVAVYPYLFEESSRPTYAYADDETKGTLTFKLPSEYPNLDNLDLVRIPMVAVLDMSSSGDKHNSTFHYVGGAVKITLTNVPAGAKYFKLWAVGKNISGNYTINLSDVGTGTLHGEGSGNTVQLNLKTGKATDKLDVYFPVPAGKYQLGIGVYGDGITYLDKTAAKEFTIGRGQVLKMPAIDIPAPSLGVYSAGEFTAHPDHKLSGITYQMNVYSFADSDGDGTGDFPGIVARLGYLDSLGVTAIWLSPSQLAQSYHGYDVKDYNSLNPKYAGGGTTNHTAEKADEAFQTLITEAHKHNIRIYMDYVINHTGDQHPWFLDVKEKGDASPYWNYYCISQNPGEDISANLIPQIPASVGNSYTGNWQPLLIGAGKNIVRYTIDLDWTNSEAPTIKVSATPNATLTSDTQPTYNNPARYLAWGNNQTPTQFADNGANCYRLVIDYQSDWGCLVRSSLNWEPGTKWGFNGTYQLPPDTAYQLYASENNNDIKDILMPDGTMYYYHSAFYTGMMPDINYGWASDCDKSNSFKDIVATVDKWLDMGLDGLRLDAVKHVYNTTGDNITFWQKFYSAINTKYKTKGLALELQSNPNADIFMVGEVLADSGTCLPYYQGLPAIFDFQFWWDLRTALKNDNKGTFVTSVEQRYRYDIFGQRSSAIATPKLSNHDEDRTASELYEMHRIRQAAAVLLTVPGRPFIYQGEELGYWGKKDNGDEYVRAPILWKPSISSAALSAIDNKYDANMLTEERSVSYQDGHAESLLTLYRHFAYARNINPALGKDSSWIESDSKTADNGSIMGWYMHEAATNGKNCLVMHNISGHTQYVERWDADNVSKETILVSSDPINVYIDNGKKIVQMPPYSSVVFALN